MVIFYGGRSSYSQLVWNFWLKKNSMRSDQNTRAFEKWWELELKKKKPTLFRVLLKVHGFEVLTITFLYAIGDSFLWWTWWNKKTYFSPNITPNLSVSITLQTSLDSKTFLFAINILSDQLNYNFLGLIKPAFFRKMNKILNWTMHIGMQTGLFFQQRIRYLRVE